MNKLKWTILFLFLALVGVELWLLVSGIWRWDRGYLDWRGLIFTIVFAGVTGWVIFRRVE
jgi:hypothetical protein